MPEEQSRTHLDDSVEDVAVVVAVPAVNAEVLHSFGASKKQKEGSFFPRSEKLEPIRNGDLLHWEKLDVDVSHGGVDDGAVRHPLGALGLSSCHHFFLGWLLVEDVSV